MAPPAAMEGDKICIYQGYKLPFVIRKSGTNYPLIGEAYSHGLMFNVEENSPNAIEVIELI